MRQFVKEVISNTILCVVIILAVHYTHFAVGLSLAALITVLTYESLPKSHKKTCALVVFLIASIAPKICMGLSLLLATRTGLHEALFIIVFLLSLLTVTLIWSVPLSIYTLKTQKTSQTYAQGNKNEDRGH